MSTLQVYRTEETLKQAAADRRAPGLKERYKNRFRCGDKGKRYNTDLLEAVELGFLLDLAEVMVVGGIDPHRIPWRRTPARTTRHRDDTNWMKHTMAYRVPAGDEGVAGTDIRLDYKPVVQTRYQPMERKY